MMSLQWTLVATILYIEVAVVVLLLLPWISPQRWMKVFKSRLLQTVESHAHIYFNVFIVVLLLLFIDAIREVRKYSAEHHEVDSTLSMPGVDIQVHMKLFRAQRNFYIAGIALFLWLVIRRLITLITNVAHNQATTDAAMAQARSASAAAQQLLDASSPGTGDENKKNEEEEKLMKELKTTKQELSTARSDMESMKKQAESTNREYDRLLKEYESLEKELYVARGSESSSGDKKSE